MRAITDDDDEAVPTSGPGQATSSEQPAWMRHLSGRCREWEALLPTVCYHLAQHFCCL
jgi:hypothetical protein